jgi:hypothetical protein
MADTSLASQMTTPAVGGGHAWIDAISIAQSAKLRVRRGMHRNPCFEPVEAPSVNTPKLMDVENQHVGVAGTFEPTVKLTLAVREKR